MYRVVVVVIAYNVCDCKRAQNGGDLVKNLVDVVSLYGVKVFGQVKFDANFVFSAGRGIFGDIADCFSAAYVLAITFAGRMDEVST